MQEPSSLIAIFNKEGNQIGLKTRDQVNKKEDLLKSVIILVVNEDLRILTIKAKDSVWPDKWGGSCAGLVRDQESDLEAAQRTLQREISITIQPTFLSSGYYEFDGIKRLLVIYFLKTSNSVQPNSEDFLTTKWSTIEEVKKHIEKDECMPTFRIAFQESQRKDYLKSQ